MLVFQFCLTIPSKQAKNVIYDAEKLIKLGKLLALHSLY